LARELGISDRAVSAALNPSETKVRLKPETAERVRKLASERNYRPDTSARSMRSGRFFNIGYFEAATSPVHYPLLGAEAGVCDVASELGYRVVLVKLPSNLSPEHNVIPSVFREAHVDALIVSHLGNLPQEHTEAIDSSTFPIIYLNEKKPRNAVYVDDVQAGRDMTTHLLSQGYRKIVFLHFEGASPHYSQGGYAHYSLADRSEGYREVMTAAGLKPEFKVSPETDWKSALEKSVMECADAEVFMCWDDLTAIRVLKVLYHLGRRVPENIAVTGFGDGESPMDVTSMRIPFYKMARVAVEMCIELIRQPDQKTLPSQVMNAELVVGETARS
jgi:LacI family transcriptional regulator